MLELAVKLLVVTGILVAGLLLAGRAGRTVRGASAIRVTSRQGLAKGVVVAVVEVDGRRFLVGAGDQHVSLLGELEPAEEPAVDEVEPGLGQPAWFRQFTHQVAAAATGRTHRRGPDITRGPRIGPLDRLRAMTVRTTLDTVGLERPIHASHPPS
jgi:flagellar biogenesis protein FliO